jgi:EmrB/QacA subfamily drug resistance transporter
MLRPTDASLPSWVLIGSCAGLFVLMLDSTVVALALPSIEHDLGATGSELQWVMNAYLLAIAAFVVTGGRLGDMFGRRTLYAIGLVAFAAGSALAASAWSPSAIVAGRIVQGVGAAPMLPMSLAMVCDAFPAERQARALGIWAAISALALGIGPVLGGVLVDVDWRLIFWVNLPILALGLWIVLVAAPDTRDETASHRVDLPGLVILAGGLTAVVLPLVEAQVWGWGSARTLGVFAAGVVLLGAFWVVEHRVAQPIVHFALFRNGPYFGATAAAFALVGAYWSVMFLQPQYLQKELGYSVISSGVLILPVTIPMIVISPLAGRLIARFGARALMTAGMLCGLVGLLALTRITDTSGYAVLLPGFLLFGVALGLVYAPMSSAAMAAMPPDKAGIASGVLAMNRVLAGALTLAVVGAVFQSLRNSDTFPLALAHVSWILVGLVAAGTLLTWLFVRSAPDPGADPTVAGSPAPQEVRHHLHHRRFHL